MNKAPAFQFYARDWICSETVAKLHRSKTRGVGAYMFLLANAWLQEPAGTLPNDLVILAELAHVAQDEFMPIWMIIHDQFPLGKTGRLENIKLVQIKHLQDVNRNNGKLGGLANTKRNTKRVLGRFTPSETPSKS